MKNKKTDIIEKNNKTDSINNSVISEKKIINNSIDSSKDDVRLSKSEISEKIKKKKSIVRDLRNLLNGVEDSLTFKKVKKLQNEWKDVGIVNSRTEKSLWSNYNALLDRFYNNRSIYFELKKLDSKKNLETKNKLCDKAEDLLKSNNIRVNISKLNKIHDEFKQTGPVPLDEKDKVWKRLKEASDKIYKNKKEFFYDIKKSLENNLIKKQEIIENIKNYESLKFDKIQDWSNSTKEILLIKDKWEKIGAVPKNQSKNLNKNFWTIFKNFFNNKSRFFKDLDTFQNKNLESKFELIKKVESINDNDNWAETTIKIQSIQKDWSKIGKVPIKMKNKVYKKFKKACDYFFDRKRHQDKDLIKEYESNYKLKYSICNKILELSEKDNFSADELIKLQSAFNKTGPVSKEKLKEIQRMFTKSIKSINKNLDFMDKKEISTFNFNLELNKILQNPYSNNKLKKKRLSLKNKISKIENEVKNLKNNVDFLRSSDNADSLKKDYDKKISEAIKEVDLLRSQLSLIKIK